MYVVIVEFSIHAQHSKAFLARVRQQAEDSLNREADCHVFDVCVNPDQDGRVLLYEVYSDREAFEAHLQSDHFHEFDHSVRDWVEGKKVSVYNRL